jgi:cytochrome P450
MDSHFFSRYKTVGKLSFTWFGPSPRVTITDPELVRDVLSNKSGDFLKTSLATRLSRMLVGGVVLLEDEKWVKHRRIMNPAFHAEKLKVLTLFLTTAHIHKYAHLFYECI